MNWVKEQISLAPSFNIFLEQVNTIEGVVISQPALCIETCKSVIEGICKTILNNKGVPFQDDLPFQGLVRFTLEQIIHPDETFNNDLIELVRRVSSVAQKLGEFRNNAGFAGHGIDVNNPRLTVTISNLALKITNVLGGFILNCYNNNKVRQQDTRIHYCDCFVFNDEFDEINPLTLGTLSLSSSKALFEQDYDAYKEAYFDFLERLEQPEP